MLSHYSDLNLNIAFSKLPPWFPYLNKPLSVLFALIIVFATVWNYLLYWFVYLLL